MHVLLPFVVTSASLEPYAMAAAICATQGDRVDSDACMQQVFDELWRAETSAIVRARSFDAEAESDAKATASAGTAWAWALDQVITTLKIHTNETYSWSFY